MLRFYANVKSITDHNVIVSVVKLAHKYQVEHLLRRSLPVFTALYPASLKNWDIRESRRKYKPLAAVYGRALPIFVVQLARTTGIDTLLPSALFECCSLSISEILGGALTSDGTLLRLDVRDQLIVLRAREALSQRARTKTFAFVYSKNTLRSVMVDRKGYNPVPLPTRQNRWEKVHQWLQGSGTGAECWLDPLSKSFPWDDFYTATLRSERVVLEIVHRKARQEVWNELPTMFGLLPWDRMKREPLC